MFTGLIKAIGVLRGTDSRGRNRCLVIDISALPRPPAAGDSVAVSGVCLTTVKCADSQAMFEISAETLARTTLGSLAPGARLNLEPALRIGDTMDGHIVLGHVDVVAKVLDIRSLEGSWEFRFSLPREIAVFVSAKGSIAVDGVSLTAVEANEDNFTVSVIPYTFAHTTLGERRPGDMVNLEADVIARYVMRWAGQQPTRTLTAELLRASGF